jgi:hypothetical protein
LWTKIFKQNFAPLQSGAPFGIKNAKNTGFFCPRPEISGEHPGNSGHLESDKNTKRKMTITWASRHHFDDLGPIVITTTSPTTLCRETS